MIPILYADLIDDEANLIRFEELYTEYRQQMFFPSQSNLKRYL